MEQFNNQTSHLNNDEKSYLRLLMNPFEYPVIRAPSLFPRQCGIYKATVRSSYIIGYNTSKYITVKFTPEYMITTPTSTLLNPVSISEYTSESTLQVTFTWATRDPYSTASLTRNNIEFRLISCALRTRNCSSEGDMNGLLAGNYSVQNNGWGTYTAGNGTTADFALMPLDYYSATYGYATMPSYDLQQIYDSKDRDWVTTFWLPSDDTRFESYDNMNASLTTANLNYSGNCLLSSMFSTITPITTAKVFFEATAVFEICGSSNKEKFFYPSYDCNSMSRILNTISGRPSVYSGSYLSHFFDS